jgi:uncharacterized protein (DUF736 family)
MAMNQLTIGSFRYVRGGYQGRLQALGIDEPLCLVSVDPREGEDTPEWRIHLGDNVEGAPVGEGWSRLGGPSGLYIAVLIDGPICPRPIEGMLLSPRHGDVHHLVWNRQPARHEEG